MARTYTTEELFGDGRSSEPRTYSTEELFGPAEDPGIVSELGDEFGKGFSGGVANVLGAGGSAKELLGNYINSNYLRRTGREGREETARQAGQYQGAVPSLENIPGDGALDTADRAAKWFAFNLGNVLPSIGATVAGGAVGALSPVPGGALIGAGLVSEALNTAEINQNLAAKGIPLEDRADTVMKFGTGAAALDMVPGAYFAKKLVGKTAAKVAARPLRKRVASGALKGFGVEAPTEAGQALMGIAAENALGVAPSTSEAMWRVLNDFAAGGIGGGTVGGVTSVLPDKVAPKPAEDTPPPPVDETPPGGALAGAETREPWPRGSGYKGDPVRAWGRKEIDESAATPTDPTAGQATAGNYQKTHVKLEGKLDGLEVAIENKKGETRKDKENDPPRWTALMFADYGYLKGTEDITNEPIDIYLGDDLQADNVYVVDQQDPATGKFDEYKVIAGEKSLADAEALYDRHFSDGSGPSRRKATTQLSTDQFKEWLANGDTKSEIAPQFPEIPGDNATIPSAEDSGKNLPAEFTPTTEWQAVPEGATIDNALERRTVFDGDGKPVVEARIKPVEDTAPEGIDTAETGKAQTFQVYTGSGRGNQGSIYAGTIDTPIISDARYGALTEDEARQYGDDIDDTPIDLRNPLVLDDDNDWRALTREAGWEFPNPVKFNDTGEQFADPVELAAMRKAIVDKGHDGIVVRLAEADDSTKLLRNVFGTSQVIQFKDPVEDVSQLTTPEEAARQRKQDVQDQPRKRRRGKRGASNEPNADTQGLAEFIARSGGVSDPGGDIRAMDGHRWHKGKPFMPRLLRDDGRDPDKAREIAAEAGYIPRDTGVAEFLTALAEDIAGRPVLTDQGQEFARQRDEAVAEEEGATRAADIPDDVRLAAEDIGVNLTDAELDAISAIVTKTGEDPADAIVDFIERDAISDAEIDNAIPGADGDIIEIPFEDIADAAQQGPQAQQDEAGQEPAPSPQDEEEAEAGTPPEDAAQREEPGGVGEGGGVDFDPEQHVKIAADDISKLRPQDVQRLFDKLDGDIDQFDDLRIFILENRPDLIDEVVEAIDSQPSRPSPTAMAPEKLEERRRGRVRKGEEIKSILENGGSVILRTATKATRYTDPNTMRVGKDGPVFQRGKNFDAVTDETLDDMLANAVRGDKPSDDAGASPDETFIDKEIGEVIGADEQTAPRDTERDQRELQARQAGKKTSTKEQKTPGGMFEGVEDADQGDLLDDARESAAPDADETAGLVPAVPGWAEFMDLLPTDADGNADISGEGMRIFEQAAGKPVTAWKDLTDDQKFEAMRVVSDGKYEPLLTTPDNAGRAPTGAALDKFLGVPSEGPVSAGDPKAATRLRTAAERLLEKANEEHDRDRLSNTVKRARESASAVERATVDIQVAETALKIADALDAGTAGPLSKVRSITHVREMGRLLRAAKRETDKSLSFVEREKREGRPAEDADFENAKLPTVTVHRNTLASLSRLAKGTRGLGLELKTMRRIMGSLGEQVTTLRDKDIDAVKAVANAVKSQNKFEADRVLDQVRDLDRVTGLGFTTDVELGDGLRAYSDLQSGKKTEDPTKVAERALVGRKIPGFFQTPIALAERMVQEADIQPGQSVLEPSAGAGRIADAVKAESPGADISVVEPVTDLRTILESKGHKIVGSNFLDLEGSYDRIVMNPPFEKGQDIDHVRRAYDMLNPGGRVVAIMSSGPFFRNDKKATEFREWLDGLGGISEQLPDGTFKESGTGTSTRIVTIDKSGNAEPRFSLGTGLTPRGEASIDEIRERVNEIFEQMAPEGTTLETPERLFGEGDAILRSGAETGERREISGKYMTVSDIIKVALRNDNPEETIRHETMHALRKWGLFTDREWSLMEMEAEVWKEKWGVTDLEEAIAYEFGAYRRGEQTRARLPAMKRMFKRLNDFLIRVANMIGGMGFRTYEDIFQVVESGEVKGRPPVDTQENLDTDPDQTDDTKYSIGAMMKQLADSDPRQHRVRGTDMQEAAIEHVMGQKETGLMEQARGAINWFKNRGLANMRQGLIDQWDAVKQLELSQTGTIADAMKSAYRAVRLTTNIHSVMGTVLRNGPLEIFTNDEGDKWFKTKAGFEGGFEAIFRPLAEAGTLHLWKGWAIGNRANRLKGEGREKMLSQDQIDELLQLGEQYPEFQETLDRWMEFNRSMLDMAEDAGVINKAQRAVWEHADYVPFYRLLEETTEAPNIGQRGGVEGADSGVRFLSGREEQVNDVLENMILNMTHLVDASMKNLAMQKVEALSLEAGVMSKMQRAWKPALISASQANDKLMEMLDLDPDSLDMTKEEKRELLLMMQIAAPQGADVVSVMRNGKRQYRKVNDALLLRAITSMKQSQLGGIMRAFRMAKRVLTESVTLDPAFMIANILRDTANAWVISNVPGFKPGLDTVKGFKKAMMEDTSLLSIMAAGGGSGGFYDITPTSVRKQLDEKLRGDARAGLLDSGRKLWRLWHKIGAASEAANRIAIYDAIMENGGNETEAAFQALDIMDFSMRGDYAAMRVLIEMVPFMNARIQGLYRLGRGFNDNRKLFLLRGAVLTAASLALLAANEDEPEYEALEEWDRDTYYHIFIDGKHFRLPKPFEVGVLTSTLPERLIRLARGQDDTRTAAKRVLSIFRDTFALDPTPQLIKPLLEQASNRITFTDRPIVGLGLQRLTPEAQYDSGTSETARILGNIMPEFMGDAQSPKRIEALVRGYTGAIGLYLLQGADSIVRLFGDYPSEPEARFDQLPVVKRFFRDSPAFSTKYQTQFYDTYEEINSIWSTIRAYRKRGENEAADEVLGENRDKIRLRGMLNSAYKTLGILNARSRRLSFSDMSPAEKRKELDRIRQRKNEITKRVMTSAPVLGSTMNYLFDNPKAAEAVREAAGR